MILQMLNRYLLMGVKSVTLIFLALLLVGHTFTAISFLMATRSVNSLAWSVIWALCGLLALCNLWAFPILAFKARNQSERIRSRVYILLAVLWGLEMILLPYGAWEYPRFADFLSSF